MFVGTLRENVTLLEKMLKEQNRPAILIFWENHRPCYLKTTNFTFISRRMNIYFLFLFIFPC